MTTHHTSFKRRSLLLAGIFAAGCFSTSAVGAQEVPIDGDLATDEAIIEVAAVAPDPAADEVVSDEVRDTTDVLDEVVADGELVSIEPIDEEEPFPDDDGDFQMPSILEVAESCIGIPFAWGGTSPETGFDSGGLTQYCYAQAGYDIGRTSYDQAAALEARGAIKYDVDELVPGDLVFPNVESVGIYVGDGMMITVYPQGAVKYLPITEFAFGGNPVVPVASPDPEPDPGLEPDPDGTPVEPSLPGPGVDVDNEASTAPLAPTGPTVNASTAQGTASLPKTADENVPFAATALAIGGTLALAAAGYARAKSHC